MDGDKICCKFDLKEIDLEPDEVKELPVHVISQDLSVYGKDMKATVRVIDDPGKWEPETYTILPVGHWVCSLNAKHWIQDFEVGGGSALMDSHVLESKF